MINDENAYQWPKSDPSNNWLDLSEDGGAALQDKWWDDDATQDYGWGSVEEKEDDKTFLGSKPIDDDHVRRSEVRRSNKSNSKKTKATKPGPPKRGKGTGKGTGKGAKPTPTLPPAQMPTGSHLDDNRASWFGSSSGPVIESAIAEDEGGTSMTKRILILVGSFLAGSVCCFVLLLAVDRVLKRRKRNKSGEYHRDLTSGSSLDEIVPGVSMEEVDLEGGGTKTAFSNPFSYPFPNPLSWFVGSDEGNDGSDEEQESIPSRALEGSISEYAHRVTFNNDLPENYAHVDASQDSSYEVKASYPKARSAPNGPKMDAYKAISRAEEDSYDSSYVVKASYPKARSAPYGPKMDAYETTSRAEEDSHDSSYAVNGSYRRSAPNGPKKDTYEAISRAEWKNHDSTYEVKGPYPKARPDPKPMKDAFDAISRAEEKIRRERKKYNDMQVVRKSLNLNSYSDGRLSPIREDNRDAEFVDDVDYLEDREAFPDAVKKGKRNKERYYNYDEDYVETRAPNSAI